MKNKLSSGETMNWTNGGTAKVSGQVVRIGNLLAICATDIGAGATGIVFLNGEFTVPKLSGAVFNAGEMLLWDASGANFDDNAATPASGDVANAAIAVVAGTNGQTTTIINLASRFGTVTP